MSSTSRTDGKAKLVLALLTLGGAGLLAIPFFLTPPATLEILLRDEIFGSNLERRTARVSYSGAEAVRPVSIRRDPAGYLARVGRIPSGSGSLDLQVDGFQKASLPIEAKPLETVRPAVALVPTFGRLEVSVRDARDNARTVPADVTANGAAMQKRDRAAVAALSPGEHRIVAKSPGYCDAERSVRVQERETTRVTLPISPEIGDGQMARVVLDWQEEPRDLDAHLNLSESPVALAAPHVYYVNKRGVTSASEIFADLDVDHQHSEGYETVTLYDQVPGVYQYFVHLYTGEGKLGDSGATVEIFTRGSNGCQRQSFTVPRDCAERWWYVADLTVSKTGVAIGPRGECIAVPSSNWRRATK